MEKIIKVGTEVMYRGCFGMFEPKLAVVQYIEQSEYERCKYGVEVPSVPFSHKDYCVFVLNDGHWCYGEQVVSVVDKYDIVEMKKTN